LINVNNYYNLLTMINKTKGKTMSNKKFLLCESEDESTDDFYVYTENRNITIQITYYAYPDIYYVNKYNDSGEEMILSIPCKSLKQAKQKAISI